MHDQSPIKSYPMDKGKSTISYLRMEPASNGFEISFEEKISKPASKENTYDNCSWKTIKEVYTDTPEDMDKAFARFRELATRQYTEMKS